MQHETKNQKYSAAIIAYVINNYIINIYNDSNFKILYIRYLTPSIDTFMTNSV